MKYNFLKSLFKKKDILEQYFTIKVNKDVEKAKEKVSNILGGLDTTEGNYANFDFTK